jgi:hypothetical protein
MPRERVVRLRASSGTTGKPNGRLDSRKADLHSAPSNSSYGKILPPNLFGSIRRNHLLECGGALCKRRLSYTERLGEFGVIGPIAHQSRFTAEEGTRTPKERTTSDAGLMLVVFAVLVIVKTKAQGLC